jgi:hypothetical protein
MSASNDAPAREDLTDAAPLDMGVVLGLRVVVDPRSR